MKSVLHSYQLSKGEIRREEGSRIYSSSESPFPQARGCIEKQGQQLQLPDIRTERQVIARAVQNLDASAGLVLSSFCLYFIRLLYISDAVPFHLGFAQIPMICGEHKAEPSALL